MSKKLLIILLAVALGCGALSFYFNHRAGVNDRELKIADRYFQRINQAEVFFTEKKYDDALQIYDEILENAESHQRGIDNETLFKIEFNQAVVWHRKAEELFTEYARALNDPQTTFIPDIKEALGLYEKPVEVLTKLQETDGVDNLGWSWRIYNDKATSLTYQIFIYLFLKNQLEESGSKEHKEQAQEYDKTARTLYEQALKNYQTARDLAREDSDKIIVIQNIEFLTRESTQNAFQQQGGEGESSKSGDQSQQSQTGEQGKEQRGLAFLAKGKDQQGQGQKMKVLPLPLGEKGKKGAGKAKAVKGKK